MLNSFQHLRSPEETLNQVQGDPAGQLGGQKSLLGGYLEATWRAVVGQRQMTEKTLNNKVLFHLSTATWRVFGKSIYTDTASEKFKVQS